MILILRYAVSALLLLVACGSGASGDDDDERLTVVTTLYPVTEIVRLVGGGDVRVVDLAPAGGEPHELELAPDDLERLLDADVVVYIGAGFQPAVEDAARAAPGRVVDLATSDTDDPHIWLDPRLMLGMIERVGRVLREERPRRSRALASRAERYASEVSALDRDFEAGLADCDRRTVVTSHAAFGRLARRYALEQRAVAGVSPEGEPDPRAISRIADLVKAEGITTVFTEPLVSSRVAATVAREAGVTTAQLDPVESLTKEARRNGDTYVTVMRRNLAALRTALGCR